MFDRKKRNAVAGICWQDGRVGDLFSGDLVLGDGARLLRGLALGVERALLAALDTVVDAAPFRHLVTPGGFRMSVAMTNCGEAGWVSDRTGYRYDAVDPDKWTALAGDATGVRGPGRCGRQSGPGSAGLWPMRA